MRAATSQVAGTLPQVNLLPDDVRQARTLGVVKRWVAASVGLTVFAVGTVAAVAQVQAQTAEAQLSQADAETAQLLAQQQPYAEVTTVRTEVDTVTAARRFAFAHEVLWSDHLGALVAVTPDGVGISSIAYRGATPLSAAPGSTDPLVDAGIGTVTFTAFARDVPDTAAWADAIDAVPGFDDARIDAVAVGQNATADFRYEVSGTFQVDAGALSHRFDAQPEGTS
jgi:hypothetical protein